MNLKEKISSVIFDCDGVMFDSRQANIHYYNHLLAHFGLPPMTEDKVSFVHMHTANESVSYIFQGTPYVEEAEEYRLQMDYAPFIKDMIIEPGLKELLRALRPHFRLAVATNRSNTIGDVLERFGLTGFFDIVVSSLDVSNPKPHPEAIFKILDFFGIGPEQSIYIGDSMVDYETTNAAGVLFISYKNRELEADYHVDGLMDIVGKVLGSRLGTQN
ncbi:MAG: HAD hydrolase-like protein [Desulfobacteraceae bacterium]|nr:HAD hydrolase-like protein [Desulfobacteraceae bacterium]